MSLAFLASQTPRLQLQRRVRIRRALKAIRQGAIAALLALTAATGSAIAAEDEVVIVGIWPFSGPYADVGPLLDNGAKVAIEEFGGTVAGKKIKYITRDSETKPSTTARRVQDAIDGEGAKFVIGPWASGVALADTEIAQKNKVMYVYSGGTEDISGKRCNRYALQWAAPAYTAAMQTCAFSGTSGSPSMSMGRRNMQPGVCGRNGNTTRYSAKS
jgi:branched-chain amino acid transport system substrate-binding protein